MIEIILAIFTMNIASNKIFMILVSSQIVFFQIFYNLDNFQTAQYICFDLVKTNYNLEMVNGHSNQFILHINYAARKDKLYLIKMILFHLKKKPFKIIKPIFFYKQL